MNASLKAFEVNGRIESSALISSALRPFALTSSLLSAAQPGLLQLRVPVLDRTIWRKVRRHAATRVMKLLPYV